MHTIVPQPKSITPWDSHWHLRAELAGVVDKLGLLLEQQRERGRTAAADAVRGLVVEEGEAEGLVAELACHWSGVPGRRGGNPLPQAGVLEELVKRAEQGARQGAFLPLRHAAQAFELRREEYDALLLAVAVEVDARFGRLVAYLNDHVGRTRPTIGLALALSMPERGGDPALPLEFCQRPLVRDGLVEFEGEGPIPGLALRLPRELMPRLAADQLVEPDIVGLRLHLPEPGLLRRLVLEDSVRRRLTAWASATPFLPGARRLLASQPLILIGVAGSGRTTAAWAAASDAGVPLVVADITAEHVAEQFRVARREARWYSAALLFRIVPPATGNAFDWRFFWSEVSELKTPLLLALPPEMLEEAASAAPHEPAVVEIAEPTAKRRAELWRVLLPHGERIDDREIDDLANRFRLTPGRIARALRRATADVSLLPPGQRQLTAAALERACRAVSSAAMGPLAEKLPLPYTKADLVVPQHVQSELDLATAWVRHQTKVMEQWGFARRIPLGHGLTALFSGPPGTGKTMAAQVLAHELGLDIYRVDLSRVMSKWIGETEKNLARLFDESQAAGAVLFFDEADALFGKRSEVKDAHDRYANVEIGYLLQRMEQYDGVTVLATNRKRDLDEAFLRRFQIIIEFPMPTEADRLRIWQGMFPAELEREADLNLHQLARDIEVSGGEIKNAVLAAAYLAVAEAKPVGMRHLKHALRRELLKGGRIFDELELGASDAS